MKYLLFTIILAISVITDLKAQDDDFPDIAVVCYNGSGNIFPSSWLTKKISAKATAADTAKFHKDTAALHNAFYKYPQGVLTEQLKTVFFTGKLGFNRQYFTGTNTDEVIYIGSNGNDEIEKTFHHEFSSILFRRKGDDMFEREWKAISPSLRSGNSASAVSSGLSSTKFDTVLCEQGYLTPYSLSNFENDFNIYAENMFAGGKEFWRLVDKYPKVMAKMKLTSLFYQRVWSGYSEFIFRGLSEDI